MKYFSVMVKSPVTKNQFKLILKTVYKHKSVKCFSFKKLTKLTITLTK